MNNIKSMNEWNIFDDPGNARAVNNWMKKGPKKSYSIVVHEPFTFKTKDSEEYYKMKYLLMLAGAKYTEKIEDPEMALSENILPKPYKEIKCLECGEITNSDLNSKFAHLYNKHNCKPSVDDYKAKEMLKKYFK